jgi:hypothetical protein
MSKALETTLCLNSFNRDFKVYPEPNDFVLDLKGRYEVQFASLGSLELPLSQYTVEAEWGSFGFDVGSSLGAEPCRTLALQLPTGELEVSVMLPAPWLQVASEGGGVWRAIAPHGLSVAALAVAGFSATVMQPGATLDPEPVTSVVDATAVLAPAAVAPPGSYGVLLVQNAGTRSFATPAQLASVLNANFSALGWPLRVDWDQQAARATLTAGAGTIAHVGEAALLLRALGFACRDGPTPIGPPRCQDLSGNQLTLATRSCLEPLEATMVSENFPLGPRIKATLNPGHYDPSSFRSSVEALLNPLSVAGIVPSSMFAVEVWGSTAVPIAVPATRTFHPRGIALAISGLLGAAGLPVVLTFEEDRFSFTTPGDPFVVTWGGTSADLDLANRLGFDPSPTPLARVATGAPRHYEDIPTSVLMPVVHDSISINQERKFVLMPRARLQREPVAPPVTVTSDGTILTVPVGAVPLEYLILVDGIFAVVERVSGDVTILRPLAGAVPAAGAYPGDVVPVLGATLNLYFFLPPRACFSRMAEIFGFPGGASSGGPGGLVAPHSWNFDQPPYVLLEFGLQHMSALVNHRCREDLKTQLFGKIVLFPNFRLERGYPLNKSSTGVSYITQLKVQMFNPDHTLYKFHGREWSVTLILGSSQRPAHTECP